MHSVDYVAEEGRQVQMVRDTLEELGESYGNEDVCLTEVPFYDPTDEKRP